jgi:hypothetical protein
LCRDVNVVEYDQHPAIARQALEQAPALREGVRHGKIGRPELSQEVGEHVAYAHSPGTPPSREVTGKDPTHERPVIAMRPSATDRALTHAPHSADDRHLHRRTLLGALKHTIKRLQLALSVHELARRRRQVPGSIRVLPIADTRVQGRTGPSPEPSITPHARRDDRARHDPICDFARKIFNPMRDAHAGIIVAVQVSRIPRCDRPCRCRRPDGDRCPRSPARATARCAAVLRPPSSGSLSRLCRDC